MEDMMVNEEGNNQQKRLDDNARENSRLYYLMMTLWSIKQVSHYCFCYLGFARCIGISWKCQRCLKSRAKLACKRGTIDGLTVGYLV
jgi:hypothetical protein